ncbi:MAG: Thioredoxin-like [Pseudomonadota bacterium]
MKLTSQPRHSLSVLLGAIMTLLVIGSARADWPTPSAYSYKEADGCQGAPQRPASYPPCIDQMAAFTAAVREAKAQKRVLLVVFGADWCPWCKALDKSLPSADVLEHPDLKGRIDLKKIALSAIIDGKRVSVPSGQAVLDWILDTSTGDLPAGIPSFAIVDPSRSGRSIVRETVPFEDNRDGRGHDPAKIRAALLTALRDLGTEKP